MRPSPAVPASSVSRRSVVFGAAALPLLASRAGAEDLSPGDIAFEALRKGRPIGTHVISFRQDGDALHVAVAIDLRVKLGFIPVFRYRHRAEETWRDGRLVSLVSDTDDNGEMFTVSAAAAADRLRVIGVDGELDLPGDITPTSYWRPETPRRSQLLDTQRGRVLEVATEPAGRETHPWRGREVPCARYAMRGDLNLDLWYTDAETESGSLAKLAFAARGTSIEYVSLTEG